MQTGSSEEASDLRAPRPPAIRFSYRSSALALRLSSAREHSTVPAYDSRQTRRIMSLASLPSLPHCLSLSCDTRRWTLWLETLLLEALAPVPPSVPFPLPAPPSMSSAFDDSFQWPVDLQELVRFTLYDEVAQRFVNSSCNTFFQPVRRCDGTLGADRRVGPEGCWDRLPEVWRSYFESVKETNEREELLMRLSRGEAVRSSSSFRAERSC